MEFDPNQILFEAASETLAHPNCTHGKRRNILMALRIKMPKSHPAHKVVEAQLANLETLDQLQVESV